MVFYENETLLGLLVSSIPILLGIYFFFIEEKEKTGLILITIGGLALRLLMISLDPYIHDWDERFHALVAKNMMEYPFKPMLRVNPILPYEIERWTQSHIWLHKQPLFMWQMALSMKLFGVNEIAMRLPSAIMGTISIKLVYDIAKFWLNDKQVAFLAGLYICCSFYQLELTSGRLGLEQNDAAFTFYITAAIWALTRYIKHETKIRWSIIIGIFVGLAILCKWLTALIVIGGWGLVVLSDTEKRKTWTSYFHIVLGVLAAVIIASPWQIYILNAFPYESQYNYELNTKHIGHVMGPFKDDPYFYIQFFETHYGFPMAQFLFLIGLAYCIFKKNVNKQLSVAFIGMLLVMYGFFSIIVATKMPSFTFPVSSIIMILIAFGLLQSFRYLFLGLKRLSPIIKWPALLYIPFAIFIFYNALQPKNIASFRSIQMENRNAKIHNASIFKNLPEEITKDRIIFNCKPAQDSELMFYQDVIAYEWFPDSLVLDSIKAQGYQLAFFKNHHNQNLPSFIVKDSTNIVIQKQIR